jgi:hypothetical protein
MPSISDTHTINSTTSLASGLGRKGNKQQRRKPMSDEKEILGKFRYEQDSKRYHRFKIETDSGIVGTVYVPKDRQSMPEKLILEYAK